METVYCLNSISAAIWLKSGIIFTLFLVSAFAVSRFFGILQKSEKLPRWLTTISLSFYRPSFWMILGYGLFLTIETLLSDGAGVIPHALLAKVRNIFITLFITWIILSWKKNYQESLKTKLSLHDITLMTTIGKVVSVLIVLISILVVMDILEVPLTAFLAFGGIGGIAVGFAGKDIVANFFGGVMVHINRPFAVGEWIKSPNKHFEGVVEEIGWYITQIRTFERRPTYIPNAIFTDAIIENPGRMYNRRIKETIGIRYQDLAKLEEIIESIRTYLKEHKAIDQNKFLMVHFLTFGPSSLDFEVYCYTKTTSWEKWRDIQQEVLVHIAKLIESHGAEIAFPTQTVHLQK